MGNPDKAGTYTSYGANNTYGADVLTDNMFPRLVIGERETNNNNLFSLSTRLNSSITYSQDAMTKNPLQRYTWYSWRGAKSTCIRSLARFSKRRIHPV